MRLDEIGEGPDSPLAGEAFPAGPKGGAIALDRIGEDGDTLHIALSPGADSVALPDAEFMLRADFSRAGPDLVLRGDDGATIVIEGYFAQGLPAELRAPNGIYLEGELVEKLAGPRAPGQYAQAGDAAAAAPIGEVKTLAGAVTVQHADGTSETLAIGDPVFANDVVETGADAAIGIQLADGSIFNLEAETRMVLDELVYVPGGDDNSLLVSLVEGTFSFVSGQVVPDGDMTMRTPVATLGIRGTWGGVTFITALSQLSVFNFPDPANNEVHPIEVYGVGGQFLGVSADAATVMQYNGTSGLFETSVLSPDLESIARRLFDNLERTVGIARSGDTQSIQGGNGSVSSGFPDFDANQYDPSGQIPQFSDGNDDNNLPPPPEGPGSQGSNTPPPAVNLPPIVTPIFAPNTNEDATVVNEDAGIVVIDLLAGQIDPEGLPLSVGGLSASVSDTRTAPPNLPVVFLGSSVSFDPAYFNYLSLGDDDVVVLFTYEVVDNIGQAVSNTAQVIVEPRNDLPILDEPVDGGVTEDDIPEGGEEGPFIALLAEGGPDLTDDGTIGFVDVDLNDTHEAEAVFVSSTHPDGAGVQLGELTAVLATDTTGTGAGGEIDWMFRVANADVQFLGEGETVVETYEITVTDNNGATSTRTIDIVITGTNDVPTADAYARVISEDGPLVTDLLADAGAADVDATDTLTVQNVAVSVTTEGGRVLDLGVDYTINGSTAVLTEAGIAKFQDLVLGEDDSFTLDYEIFDGHVAVANSLDVTVIGANDRLEVTTAPPRTGLSNTPIDLSEEISVIDIGEGDPVATVTLEVQKGTLTLASLANLAVAAGANGTALIAVTGLLSDINAALGSVSYTPNLGSEGGSDLLTVTADDGAGDTDVKTTEIYIFPPGSPVPQLGTAAGETLNGTPGGDILIGLDGDDTLNGIAGIDRLFGGRGDDTLNAGVAERRVALVGGRGDDTLNGVAGSHSVAAYQFEYLDGFQPVSAVFTAADGSHATVTDSFGDTDTLNEVRTIAGTPGADSYDSTAVTDPRSAGTGFMGLGGADLIRAGLGPDTLIYEFDARFGGLGGIVANLTDSQVNIGTLAAPILFGTANDGFGEIRDGFGSIDLVQLAGIGGLSNIEYIRGTSETDYFFGDAGRNAFAPNLGNDVIVGGGESDLVRYDDGFDPTLLSGFKVDLSTGQVSFDYAGVPYVQTLTGIERVLGTIGGDTMIGGAGEHVLNGYRGNDTIEGGSGPATLIGGRGADLFRPGTGLTVLDYTTDHEDGGNAGIAVNLSDAVVDLNHGVGAPNLFGTAGDGFAEIRDGFGHLDRVELAGPGALSGIDGVRGTPFDDVFFGDAGDNTFAPGAGNDYADGGAGTADRISYRSGFADPGLLAGLNVNLGTGIATYMYDGALYTDTFVNIEAARGSSRADTLIGDGLANILEGEGGIDILMGEGGADFLDGGDGPDTLTGGADADTFNLASLDGIDTITDYSRAEGDALRLAALLDGNANAGNIGDYVRATDDGGGNTTIAIDVDGAANGANFVDVAVLTGVGAGSQIDVVFDDAAAAATVTSV